MVAVSRQIYALLKELLEELGHRESATPEELRAADHLQSRFHAMGYSTEIQTFAFRHFDFRRWYQTGGKNAYAVVQGQEFSGLVFATPPKSTTVTGPLTPVELGQIEDLPPQGLEGRVVWFQPQDGILDDKQALQDLHEQIGIAADAGAVAAVISGNLDFNSYTPLLTVESAIPALLFGSSEGRLWADALSDGQVEISITVEVQELESRNVVAEMRGAGDSVVVVGAHYDIVPATTAGANDNTSGIAVVLSLAEALAGRPLPYAVRFIAFGAEELGLYGSRHYVASLPEAELARVRAMMNFDVVGSGDHLEAAGNQALTDLALNIAAELEIEAQPGSMPPGAASDHVPFEDAGIPTLLLFGPDISRIHTPEDRLEFVQPELLGSAYLIALATLQSQAFLLSSRMRGPIFPLPANILPSRRARSAEAGTHPSPYNRRSTHLSICNECMPLRVAVPHTSKFCEFSARQDNSGPCGLRCQYRVMPNDIDVLRSCTAASR